MACSSGLWEVVADFKGVRIVDTVPGLRG